jgi:hypothetical protein
LACDVSILNGPCFGNDTDSFSESHVIGIPVGSGGFIQADASVSIGGGATGHYGYAMVDPTIEIEPGSTVMVEGNPVLANELYEVVLSENVQVPEPGAAALAAGALAALAARATRERPAPRHRRQSRRARARTPSS